MEGTPVRHAYSYDVFIPNVGKHVDASPLLACSRFLFSREPGPFNYEGQRPLACLITPEGPRPASTAWYQHLRDDLRQTPDGGWKFAIDASVSTTCITTRHLLIFRSYPDGELLSKSSLLSIHKDTTPVVTMSFDSTGVLWLVRYDESNSLVLEAWANGQRVASERIDERQTGGLYPLLRSSSVVGAIQLEARTERGELYVRWCRWDEGSFRSFGLADLPRCRGAAVLAERLVAFWTEHSLHASVLRSDGSLQPVSDVATDKFVQSVITAAEDELLVVVRGPSDSSVQPPAYRYLIGTGGLLPSDVVPGDGDGAYRISSGHLASLRVGQGPGPWRVEVDVWEVRQRAAATRVARPLAPLDAGMSELPLTFCRPG